MAQYPALPIDESLLKNLLDQPVGYLSDEIAFNARKICVGIERRKVGKGLREILAWIFFVLERNFHFNRKAVHGRLLIALDAYRFCFVVFDLPGELQVRLFGCYLEWSFIDEFLFEAFGKYLAQCGRHNAGHVGNVLY